MLETLKSFYDTVAREGMTQSQIDRVCEPLAKMPKAEVIAIAHGMGLVGYFATRKAAIKAINNKISSRWDSYNRTRFGGKVS